MTPAQQDQVVDECFNCKLCYVNCPYIPGQHEWELDFPRLMLRAEQVLFKNRKRSLKDKSDRLRARQHRPRRQDQHHAGTGRQQGARHPEEQATRSRRDRGRASPRSGSCRPTPSSGSPAGSRKRDTPEARREAGPCRAVPHVHDRVHRHRHRQGHRQGLRAQRHPVRSARRRGLLWCAVPAPGRCRQVPQARREEREGSRRRHPHGQGRRRRRTSRSPRASPPAATSSSTTTRTTSADPTPSWWPHIPPTLPSS